MVKGLPKPEKPARVEKVVPAEKPKKAAAPSKAKKAPAPAKVDQSPMAEGYAKRLAKTTARKVVDSDDDFDRITDEGIFNRQPMKDVLMFTFNSFWGKSQDKRT